MADDEYTEMVLSTGTFIDADFLEEVLSGKLGELKVVDFEVAAAVAQGDNYLGILYRTSVNYTTSESEDIQTLHVMVKGLPTGQLVLNFIEDLGIFAKEINMYNKVLPTMHRYLREFFPEGTLYVGPDSYPCSRESTLVMEDLRDCGYKMANRRDQLDFAHSATVLRNLARFHALSYKTQQCEPEIMELVDVEAYVQDNKEKIAVFLEQCLPLLASVIDGWEGREHYADVLRSIGLYVWDKLVYVATKSEHFNVLIHGDLWTNNVMFRYDDDGEVESCRLIDFQLPRFNSPAWDLHYFFFTSVKPDVLCNQMFELLDIYHENLTADLITLEMDVDYPLDRLHQDMREYALYGVVVLGQLLPITVAPMGGVDFEDADDTDDDNMFLTNFKHSHYKEVCGRYLEHMDNVGYLQNAKDLLQDVEDAAREAAEEAAKVQEEEEARRLEESRKNRLTSAKRRKLITQLRSTVWGIFGEPTESEVL